MHVNVDGATERLSDIVPGVLLTDASLAGGPGDNGQDGEHRRRPRNYRALTCSDAHGRLLRCKDAVTGAIDATGRQAGVGWSLDPTSPPPPRCGSSQARRHV